MEASQVVEFGGKQTPHVTARPRTGNDVLKVTWAMDANRQTQGAPAARPVMTEHGHFPHSLASGVPCSHLRTPPECSKNYHDISPPHVPLRTSHKGHTHLLAHVSLTC